MNWDKINRITDRYATSKNNFRGNKKEYLIANIYNHARIQNNKIWLRLEYLQKKRRKLKAISAILRLKR